MSEENAGVRGLPDPVRTVRCDGLEPLRPGVPAGSLEDPKARAAFVRSVEARVRQSKEYRDYAAFLSRELGMDRCTFMPDVSRSAGKNVKIELHHSILTLFDVVVLVLNAACAGRGAGHRVSELDLADEVVALHYENLVPLVPLSKTAHEMVHSGRLTVGLDQVFGDLGELARRYRAFMPGDVVAKLRDAVEAGPGAGRHEALARVLTVLESDSFPPFSPPGEKEEVRDAETSPGEAA